MSVTRVTLIWCIDVLHDKAVNGECWRTPQDESRTLSANYEQQLSVMSDHVCSLNEQLVRRTENAHSVPQRGSVGVEVKGVKVSER